MKSARHPPFTETLTREVSWECPGLWSGELSAAHERTLTDHSARLSFRVGESPASAVPEMKGDFTSLLEILHAPRLEHWEKAPPRAATPSRKGEAAAGPREWRMNGIRRTTLEIGGKKPVKLRRHERFDWRWASGPYGEIPGSGGLKLPATPTVSPPGDSDGPLVIAAPLAAYLLERIARRDVASEILRPVPSSIAFDDEGFPPTPVGHGARRSVLEPWPRPLPGGYGWQFDRPTAAVESLPAAFIACSFAALEVEEEEFHWALPYFNCRHGKLSGVAGIHLLTGRLDELGELVKAFGDDSSASGLAPQCSSPSLILRPLSKLKGRRIPFTPQPESDFVIEAAREFVQSLL